MNLKFLSLTLLATLFSVESCSDSKDKPVVKKEPRIIVEHDEPNLIQSDGSKKIQVSLLLDTSGSMEGLIEQAKSRLWNIVNTLTTLKYEGETPTIEIALYEYGNIGLADQRNYIREISSLTTDLDIISEKLFSLTTNGGDEYCGAVIYDAAKSLKWSNNRDDMRLIYIAGNEEFDQGGINYKEAIAEARKKDIYVNTIFCGDHMEGIETFWKQGADVGKGKFFTINSDEKVSFIETPYDQQISKCNMQFNDTYVQYGAMGAVKKSNQLTQDYNARSISSSNCAERAVCKSSGAYKNVGWDLVDKVENEKGALRKIKKSDLPKELQHKSTKEIEKYIQTKAKERKAIQQEIAGLARKRQEYIDRESKKMNGKNDLGSAIKNSILEFAKTKGYTTNKEKC